MSIFTGQRICLVGAFAPDETRDKFASMIRQYFKRWIDALCASIVRTGASLEAATSISEDTIGSISGRIDSQ
ncbi:hypothetical protein J7E85_09840 [Paenibacillus sp. ISL-20]|nr:hypothetical protein [Paenibacillus sp. ISL-20]